MALVQAQADVQAAFKYIDTNRFNAARIKIDQALKADPKAPSAWDALAYIEEASGNPELAEHHYLKAIKLNPKSGPSHNNYGTFLCHRERFDEAIKQFTLATSEPNYYNADSAFENAGLCSLKAGNLTGAKKYFLSAVRVNPQLPHSMFELAILFYKEKDYQHASFFLESYRKLVPKTGPLSDKLHAYLKMKDHPKLPAFLPEPLPSRS